MFFIVKYSHLFNSILFQPMLKLQIQILRVNQIMQLLQVCTYNIYFCKKVVLYTTNLETWNFGKIFRNLPFFFFYSRWIANRRGARAPIYQRQVFEKISRFFSHLTEFFFIKNNMFEFQILWYYFRILWYYNDWGFNMFKCSWTNSQ